MTTEQNETGPAHVLVADNDEGLTRALAIRMEEAGMVCHTACSGLQAMAVFKANPIDVIITDLNMPGGGGEALIHAVRQTSDVPIIVLTGFANEMGERVRGQGVLKLNKPFDAQALMDLVELELLDRRSEAA